MWLLNTSNEPVWFCINAVRDETRAGTDARYQLVEMGHQGAAPCCVSVFSEGAQRRAQLCYPVAQDCATRWRDYTPLLCWVSRYAEVITPWASATAARMIAEVSRRDEQAWFRTSQNIGRDLRKEIRDAPVGAVMRQLHQDQVHLITSIPLEAAKRVQELTQEYLVSGRRYEDLVPMVMNTTGVTLSRATLIARTETSKAASALVQARALHIGSTHYVWHTVQDIYVRKTHRELNGTTQSWTDPPIAEENGERHHPGAFPNCRCFSVPVLSDVIE
jgi:SPP1 gp7 family putative phage head morphogenesis protein